MTSNRARVLLRAQHHAVRPRLGVFEEDELATLALRRRVEGLAGATRALHRDDQIERLLLDLDQVGAPLCRYETIRLRLVGALRVIQPDAERKRWFGRTGLPERDGRSAEEGERRATGFYEHCDQAAAHPAPPLRRTRLVSEPDVTT